MRIFLAALLASGMIAAPSLGNDINSSLKEFGLNGAWSSDCSGTSGRISRLSFAAADGGGATVTAVDDRGGESVTTVYLIFESAMVASDKIGIGLHPVGVTHSDGENPSKREYDNMHLVFQKAGKRIQLIKVQYEGLPEIDWTRFYEKCAT